MKKIIFCLMALMSVNLVASGQFLKNGKKHTLDSNSRTEYYDRDPSSKFYENGAFCDYSINSLAFTFKGASCVGRIYYREINYGSWYARVTATDSHGSEVVSVIYRHCYSKRSAALTMQSILHKLQSRGICDPLKTQTQFAKE